MDLPQKGNQEYYSPVPAMQGFSIGGHGKRQGASTRHFFWTTARILRQLDAGFATIPEERARMRQPDSAIERLIHRVRQADDQTLGELPQMHRAYLNSLARRHLGGRLAGRLDESDAVQQTCLSAHRNFHQFRGRYAGEFVVWLRRIHELNLRNVLRDQLDAGKRAADREQPLAEVQPLDDGPSPTRRAILDEQAVMLSRALEKLPEHQAEAVRLRYLEGLSLADIAARMGTTIAR
jgi:RNA polymerase sigma-70 factor, ECF subfamily